jgi:UDP-glucose 4-epimerase
MNISKSKILVIGGAGFIGSFVVAELLKEDVDEIVIYDNFTRGKIEYIHECLLDSRCSIFPFGGDIRDIDILDAAIRGKDYVICLASMWLLHCKEFPRAAFDVNVAGTFNVLEACAKHNIKKLIWSSSASVYGDAVELPMNEDHPFNNSNFYGATKIAGEAMCKAFSTQNNLSIICLRYMNVYGPNQDQKAVYSGVIPTILNKVAANETPIINGDGSQSYDFIYVEDVARCNVAALKSNVYFDLYNVCTEVPTTIKVLCNLILSLKNSNLNVIYKPYELDDIRSLVLNRIGSKKKAKDELGFLYEYSLSEGLKKLIDWRILTGIDKKQ